METLTSPIRRPSDSPAAVPRWLMLNRFISKDDAAADARTTAASCTSSGLPFSLSLSLAAPPAVSSFHCRWVRGAGSTAHGDDDHAVYSSGGSDAYLSAAKKYSWDHQIIAAHDGAVLLEYFPDQGRRRSWWSTVTPDYFVYEAGGASRTPSLSLLPGRRDDARKLGLSKDTGVLRRGDGEGDVLVAQLDVDYGAQDGTAELSVLRPGAHDWVIKRVPIVHHDGAGGAGEVRRCWTEIDAAVPVGRRFMCWVFYTCGFLLCDMEEEDNPELRYVPLPVPCPKASCDCDRPHLMYCRSLAAAGTDAVRFVSIAPRCCCGGPGQSSCERSRFAYTVTTWTLTLTAAAEEPMAWVKDGVLDCDELWRLPEYGCLPRVPLEYPIVSSDDPDIVCFTVGKRYGVDETVWMVEINTRSKALLSVVRSADIIYSDGDLFPAKLHW